MGDEDSRRPRVVQRSNTFVHLALAVVLLIALVASACLGAFTFTPARIASYVAQSAGWIPLREADTLGRNVFFQLRLPRLDRICRHFR